MAKRGLHEQGELDRFKEHRARAGLPFEESFVPREWDDLADLDDAYAAAEHAAQKTATRPACRVEKAARADTVTRAQLLKKIDELYETVGMWILDVYDALKRGPQAHLAHVDERLAALEAKQFRYLGVHRPGMKAKPTMPS